MYIYRITRIMNYKILELIGNLDCSNHVIFIKLPIFKKYPVSTISIKYLFKTRRENYELFFILLSLNYTNIIYDRKFYHVVYA